jgi:hypothetical protein
MRRPKAAGERMMALTVWSPWSSLIVAGAKPFEFRHWDYRDRAAKLVGQRIAIHSGARPIKRSEVQDLLLRLNAGERATALIIAKALPIVETALTSPGRFPLAAVLGTAILGVPRLASVLFGARVADSDRIDAHLWAWPLSEIECFDVPVPARGAQGFWRFKGTDA